MAPASQAPAKRAIYDGSKPRFESIDAWLNVYGQVEYNVYKRSAKSYALSYDDWTKSEHVLGPYLWYMTLDVWEESSSSDEESEVETPVIVPPKTAATNGHGKKAVAKPSKPAPKPKTEDATASAKRKRKPRKPYLSEDIVKSDDSDEGEARSPAVQAQTSAASTSTSSANGRRKSATRKKKQFLRQSAELISPEDEEEDAMIIDDTAVAPLHSYELGAPAESRDPIAATPEPSNVKSKKKKTKKPKSQAVVSQNEDDHLGDPIDDVGTPKNTAASPEGPGSASSRRGLRTRTPAQQRPYHHNAQVFEELVAEPEEQSTARSPPMPKTKLKLTNLRQVFLPENTEKREEQENVTMLEGNGEEEIELEPEERHPRRAHYKGKGRAWKKTSDDEDEDFKAPIKIKTPTQPKRQTTRRKSAQLNQAPVLESELGKAEEQNPTDDTKDGQAESSTQNNAHGSGKKPRKPRRSNHLSEEFVRDDSDTAQEEPPRPVSAKKPTAASSSKTTPRKKGRPRKSDQASASKEPVKHEPRDNLPATGSAGSSKKETPMTETPAKETAKERPRKSELGSAAPEVVDHEAECEAKGQSNVSSVKEKTHKEEATTKEPLEEITTNGTSREEENITGTLRSTIADTTAQAEPKSEEKASVSTVKQPEATETQGESTKTKDQSQDPDRKISKPEPLEVDDVPATASLNESTQAIKEDDTSVAALDANTPIKSDEESKQ